ncbi:MAG: hypothetical protein ACRCY8_06960 [Dermatophilaceae bacterium]
MTTRPTTTRLAVWMVAAAAVVGALAWFGQLVSALALTAAAGSAWTLAAAAGAATPPTALPPTDGTTPPARGEPDPLSPHRIAEVTRELHRLRAAPVLDLVDRLDSVAEVRAAGAARAVAALERAVGR